MSTEIESLTTDIKSRRTGSGVSPMLVAFGRARLAARRLCTLALRPVRRADRSAAWTVRGASQRPGSLGLADRHAGDAARPVERSVACPGARAPRKCRRRSTNSARASPNCAHGPRRRNAHGCVPRRCTCSNSARAACSSSTTCRRRSPRWSRPMRGSRRLPTRPSAKCVAAGTRARGIARRQRARRAGSHRAACGARGTRHDASGARRADRRCKARADSPWEAQPGVLAASRAPAGAGVARPLFVSSCRPATARLVTREEESLRRQHLELLFFAARIAAMQGTRRPTRSRCARSTRGSSAFSIPAPPEVVAARGRDRRARRVGHRSGTPRDRHRGPVATARDSRQRTAAHEGQRARCRGARWRRDCSRMSSWTTRVTSPSTSAARLFETTVPMFLLVLVGAVFPDAHRSSARWARDAGSLDCAPSAGAAGRATTRNAACSTSPRAAGAAPRNC